MAIPISLPTSDDVEDSYRSLDLLLEQLLVTLRQILAHRRQEQHDLSTLHVSSRQRSTNTTSDHQTSVAAPSRTQESLLVVDSHPRLPLPDLIPESAGAECDMSRRKTPTPAPLAATATATVSTWVQVGSDLRRIADSFRAERAPQQSTDAKSSRLKEPSLISLFCPALGRSLWTTVALLLGWGIFSRTR